MWLCLVCLQLCKEQCSSPVSAITERMDMGLYEVPLSMSLLGCYFYFVLLPLGPELL